MVDNAVVLAETSASDTADRRCRIDSAAVFPPPSNEPPTSKEAAPP